MTCPFYGYALHASTPDEHRRHFGAALIASGGNQCALITTAHSPCWMEVAEQRSPAWTECPHNPEFVAISLYARDEGSHWQDPGEELAVLRIANASRHLNHLMRISAESRRAAMPRV